MCGIITQIKKKDDGIPTNMTIIGMLASQIARGREGFGYIAFEDKITNYTRRETQHEIEKCLGNTNARSIMFHHRLPTSTPNYADCTHPIKVSHQELKHDYYLIHNGMISNDTILHDKHIELGYEYNTKVEKKISTQNYVYTTEEYNDSEALAIDIARYLEKKQSKIESKGSIAFVMARIIKEEGERFGEVDAIFFGRNSSPLTINYTKNSLILRSEGENESVEANKLFCLNMSTFKIDSIPCQIGEILSNRYGGNSSHEYNNVDWDDVIGSTAEYVYEGGTQSRRKYDIDTTSEEFLIENWIESEKQKHRTIIEQLEEKVAWLNDDLNYYNEHSPDDLVGIQEIKDQLKKCENDLDKFSIDLALLESGEFDDVITEA